MLQNLLLGSLLVSYCWATLLIQSSNESLSLDIYKWNLKTFQNTSFPLVFTDENDQYQIDIYPTCLVLYPRTTDTRWDTRALIRSLKSVNLLCVLVPSSFADNWFTSINEIIDVPFPVGIINLNINSFQKFKSVANSTSIIGIFEGWNVYKNRAALITIISIDFTLLFLTFGVMCWAIYKLYYIYRFDQFGMNIGTVCLSMETLCCLFRLLRMFTKISEFFSVTPSSNMYAVTVALLYFSFPFALSSGLFLVFFWIDITVPSSSRGDFLDKAFWPCVVFVVFAFLLVYITIILFLLGYTTQFVVFLSGGAILFFSLIVAILYFIAAHRIRQKYLNDRTIGSNEFLIKMTNKVVLSGVVIVIIVVACVILLVFVRTGSIAFDIMNEIMVLFFILRSYLQIEVFATPKPPQTKDNLGDSYSIALQTTLK